MVPHFNNIISSSFLLYLDNLICRQGQAYTNVGSKFYNNNIRVNNYHAYSLPYAQIVSDSSINGATVMTGLYLNNNFIIKGQSGFIDFNYDKGQAYFSTGLPTGAILSGNFAIKDFNCFLCNVPESTLMFETKFVPRSKINQTPTGLNSNELTYPAVYVKNTSKNITPLAIGGGDEWNKTNFSVYIFADSLFNCDAVKGIIHDSIRDHFGLISPNENSFNLLGGLKTGVYNYLALSQPKINNNSGIYICEVKDATFNNIVRDELTALNPEIYTAVIDFETLYTRTKNT